MYFRVGTSQKMYGAKHIIIAALMSTSKDATGKFPDVKFKSNYTLKINDSTAQTILISFISYQPIEALVHPKKGEVIVKDFVLKSLRRRQFF